MSAVLQPVATGEQVVGWIVESAKDQEVGLIQADQGLEVALLVVTELHDHQLHQMQAFQVVELVDTKVRVQIHTAHQGVEKVY